MERKRASKFDLKTSYDKVSIKYCLSAIAILRKSLWIPAVMQKARFRNEKQRSSFLDRGSFPKFCEQSSAYFLASYLSSNIGNNGFNFIKIREFKKGETVFFQDEEADFLYIIIEGIARLGCCGADSNEFTYAFAGPEDVIGELGVFQGSIYAESAIAISHLRTLAVDRNAFSSLEYEKDKSVLGALSKLVAHRFRTYIKSTRVVCSGDMTMRVAGALLQIGEQIGENAEFCDQRALRICSFVTQSDIGRLANVSRSNVSRKLKEFEKAGFLKADGRSIYLLDKCSLKRVHEGCY
ncbi:cyclic nucleotide-binding domain protein [Rhodobacteraceae bacterium KLH11]|nr:cyclic nucleotide-binding domain protein [Rhodobacteraceae bacterium KLH11]